MTSRAGLLIALVACSSPQRSPMYPAGTDRDDGYGDLARMSARLTLGGRSDAPAFGARRSNRARPDGEPYGGEPYTDDDDSDSDSDRDAGDPAAPHDPSAPPPSTAGPRYTPVAGLTGAIEGAVTWRGAAPLPRAAPCGTVDRAGARDDRAVVGALVYIEHVEIGRTLPANGRLASVGGVVTKRGCTLGPAVQIVTPLPADLAIHGDASAVTLRVTLPGGARTFELQPGGRVMLTAEPGVIQVAADDGSLAPAWIIASNTPYYAFTDDRGRFRIDELAAGSYDVTFWLPPTAGSAGKPAQPAPIIVHRRIKVDLARPARVEIAVP